MSAWGSSSQVSTQVYWWKLGNNKKCIRRWIRIVWRGKCAANLLSHFYWIYFTVRLAQMQLTILEINIFHAINIDKSLTQLLKNSMYNASISNTSKCVNIDCNLLAFLGICMKRIFPLTAQFIKNKWWKFIKVLGVLHWGLEK